MLELTDINTYYGRSHILENVSLTVERNEVVSLVGRNGVGKTTTMRSIVGLTPPKSGRITFEGSQISGKQSPVIADAGVGFVPQERRLFPDLTVLENLKMGLGKSDFDPERLEEVYERFPRLEERGEQQSGTLSGGEQQMVAMARALMGNPKLLLLDEPTEGLMPSLVEEIADITETLVDEGYSILLVEQNVEFVLDVSDRIYFMDNGKIKLETTPDALEGDRAPLDRHLGVGAVE